MQTNQNPLHREVIAQARTLMTAGFSFVAALAWNEAIQTLLKALLPHSSSTIVGKFVYAISVTIALVVVTSRIGNDNSIETK